MYGQKCGSTCLMQREKKAKQRWAIEKPKLDNARRLRGIFFIEPEDQELKHTMKNARGGVPKAGLRQAAADSRGSRTCVCANTYHGGVAHAGREGRINVLPWHRPVGVVSTSSESHMEGRPGCSQG